MAVRPGSSSMASVIAVSGPLVIENLFKFQDAWRSDQSQVLIFDFGGLLYMDSSAIGSLVNAHVHRAKSGRKMALAAVPERVKQLLQVTKVDSLFQFFATVADAETALMPGSAHA